MKNLQNCCSLSYPDRKVAVKKTPAMLCIQRSRLQVAFFGSKVKGAPTIFFDLSESQISCCHSVLFYKYHESMTCCFYMFLQYFSENIYPLLLQTVSVSSSDQGKQVKSSAGPMTSSLYRQATYINRTTSNIFP